MAADGVQEEVAGGSMAADDGGSNGSRWCSRGGSWW